MARSYASATKTQLAHHMKESNILNFVKNFTPNWYATTMGTGITAICLNTLTPFFAWLSPIATGLWLLNIMLFLFFTLVLLCQSILHPEAWWRLLHHPTQAMFLGCIPMGLMTIVNGFVLFGGLFFGAFAIHIASLLWWLDTFLSILSVLVVPYCMFTRQQHALESMTAVWLLPFVACEVAAAGGGLLLPHLSAESVISVLLFSLVLWSISVSLALSILVIFFHRLCIHKFPPKELAASIWLPLGPTGTGSLAMLLLGQNSLTLSAPSSEPMMHLLALLPGVGLLAGILLWALASWWFMIACVATVYYLVQGQLQFNLGFWAYTFPLGVYTMATVNLGIQTDLLFFHIFGRILVIALSLIWLSIFARTFIWKGRA